MPEPDEEKGELLKTPPGDLPQPTPPGTPAPADDLAETQIVAEATSRSLAQRYDVTGEVGRGGMGIVYRARDRETGEVVALKVLKPEIAGRPEQLERFKAELRLARRITHKHACRTHELLRLGDAAVIAMEYVEGESLRSILQRFGGVPLRRGLEWARQICSALAEAHAQGIVHRDLKPENVVIDRAGQAKVMDFGLARAVEAGVTTTGELVGTPAYMSPEQAEGKPADARSDIYSLGLVLYEMFAGCQPFQADTAVALLNKQIHETPPPPISVEPDLPAYVDRAIRKCLEKDPRKRFQSVADLEAALTRKRVAEPEAVEAELPAHLTRARRSDLALLLLGALGLAAFVFCAPEVIPQTRLRVGLTRGMFYERAQEEVRSRGWEPTRASRAETNSSETVYEFLAERVGGREAHRRLEEDLDSYYLLCRQIPQAGQS